MRLFSGTVGVLCMISAVLNIMVGKIPMAIWFFALGSVNLYYAIKE